MSERTGVLNGFSQIRSEMKNITHLSGTTRTQRASWLQVLLLMLFWTCLKAQQLKNTRWPLYSGKPLLLAWNAPTEDCRPRHDVTFQLDQFQIVASPNEGFTKQNLTIFYQDRLGLYPYFKPDSTPVYGGLPQAASLTQHLEKMPDGLKKYIKDQAVKGLAVIDWEEWRPLWIRNWGPKLIYRDRSQRSVAEKNPTWPLDQVTKVAQQEFELSARKFMLETLRLAKSLRPQQLWGYYLFPDCYNHNYQTNLQNYTGQCPDIEVGRNNELKWLWTESTALYPSVYMGKILKDNPKGRQFVRNRVKEGMRLASVGDGSARPVFVYTRPTYLTNTTSSNPAELLLLTEMDLVSTIGESVALGVAGVILWGDSTPPPYEATQQPGFVPPHVPGEGPIPKPMHMPMPMPHPHGGYYPPLGHFPHTMGEYAGPGPSHFAPGHTATVLAPPGAATTTVTVLQGEMFQSAPVQTVCPHCQQPIITRISHDIGLMNTLVCMFCFFVGCDLGCCLIPCLIDDLKDVTHTCPNCKGYIYTYKRIC